MASLYSRIGKPAPYFTSAGNPAGQMRSNQGGMGSAQGMPNAGRQPPPVPEVPQAVGFFKKAPKTRGFGGYINPKNKVIQWRGGPHGPRYAPYPYNPDAEPAPGHGRHPDAKPAPQGVETSSTNYQPP